VSTEQREKQTKFKEISVQDFCSYNFDLVLDKRDLTEKGKKPICGNKMST